MNLLPLKMWLTNGLNRLPESFPQTLPGSTTGHYFTALGMWINLSQWPLYDSTEALGNRPSCKFLSVFGTNGVKATRTY